MNKITIVDYIGYCDEHKNPVGHPIKTLNDFSCLLIPEYQIKLIIPMIYKKGIDGKIGLIETIDVDTSKCDLSKLYKLKHNFVKLKSVIKILLKEKGDIWFLTNDIFLYIGIILFATNKNKIIITEYIDYSGKKGLKNLVTYYLQKKAMRKIKLILTSNKNQNEEKKIFLPDYYFDPKEYSQPLNKIENVEVLMVGHINSSKDVINLIKAFNKNRIRLKIIGKFSDQKILKECLEIANENILISNKYLKKEEYDMLISESNYVVLPYVKESYSNRSSGVILEALFANSTVIAPQFLLDYLGVKGISYNDICELNDLTLPVKEHDVINNSDLIKEYSKDRVKNTLLSALKMG